VESKYILHIATLFTICLCIGNPSARCKENERQALLVFKHDLEDPSNQLSSWAGEGDCCSWFGVVRDNSTGQFKVICLKTFGSS
ncbi:unnamed protein product, partial [Prunus brigantina]